METTLQRKRKRMARQYTPMYMKDRETSLNEFLTFRKRNILEGRGKISNEQMERLALAEYTKYKARILNMPPVFSDNDVPYDGFAEIEIKE